LNADRDASLKQLTPSIVLLASIIGSIHNAQIFINYSGYKGQERYMGQTAGRAPVERKTEAAMAHGYITSLRPSRLQRL
jgi:hypothetical protein